MKGVVVLATLMFLACTQTETPPELPTATPEPLTVEEYAKAVCDPDRDAQGHMDKGRRDVRRSDHQARKCDPAGCAVRSCYGQNCELVINDNYFCR